ncbi:ankyrin repeat-containing protein BDA1-like [Salvia divinorum]|uniref:Ankyrin repeat-containing protein BDA1-like n=1 Tax=Salvia divinorum TaxID=28513 RepID=A0ABD1H698_SALDI
MEDNKKIAENENFFNITICEKSCEKKNSGDACCIAKIYHLLKGHANELKEMEEAKFAETPLHKAAAAGNTEVALEILSLMPSLGRKLNSGGSSPLHLAIEKAHRDTARFMARFNKMLVRVKGKHGMTPLMLCASRAGNEDHEERRLLARLLLACPESVSDVNNLNQTVVHVALVNQGCKTVCMLVDWLRRRNRITSVLSVKDINGNTALHAAAQFGCEGGAKKLVGLMKVNRLNSENKTALDLAKHPVMVDILKRKGAKNGVEIYNPTTTDYVLSDATFPEAISRAYYYLTVQLTLEMRNTILVVATLIVAATYQGVLQPPGGLYPAPETETSGKTLASSHRPFMGRRVLETGEDTLKKHLAGQMVMEKAKYRYFMPSNTFAFALSIVIVIFVVPGTPVFLILHICLLFMSVSYLLALDAISYYTGISDMIFYMAVYAIGGAYIVKLLYYPVKALLIDEDWWLRGISVKFDNFCIGSKGKFYTATMKMKKQHMVLRLN